MTCQQLAKLWFATRKPTWDWFPRWCWWLAVGALIFIVSHGCHGLGSDHTHDEDLEPGLELVRNRENSTQPVKPSKSGVDR